MSKLRKFSLVFLSAGIYLSFNNAHAQSLEIDGFPESCSEATMRAPLDGHIIRAGTVGWTRYGWSFFFPDRNETRNLQRVDVAENVGRIGQDPDESFSDMIRARTPDGTFVVAQIFVGDSDNEPVVTCLSLAIPFRKFAPSYYLGRGWDWLGRDVFIERLKWKKYSKWNWRKWWGDKYFDNARMKYRKFKAAPGRQHWFKKDRDGHRAGKIDRAKIMPIKKRQEDTTRRGDVDRAKVMPIKKDKDDDDSRMIKKPVVGQKDGIIKLMPEPNTKLQRFPMHQEGP
jgi:hypothetical protein